MNNIGLFILSFKPFCYDIPNKFTILECGASLKETHFSDVLDNNGDNISDFNKYYCEATGTYWIWKNVNTNIKGQMQYRRFLNVEPNNAEAILNFYDIIMADPFNFGYLSLEQQYASKHDINDLLKCKEIIDRLYPEYSNSYDKYIKNGNLLFYSSGYITTSKIFDDMCKFCFDILFKFTKETNYGDESILISHAKDVCKVHNKELTEENIMQQMRIGGYLMERLVTLYIFHNKLKICKTGNYILKEKNMEM